MKKLIFSFLLASTFTIQQAQTTEESIVGYWLAFDSIFEIKNCDGALCGEIVQVFFDSKNTLKGGRIYNPRDGKSYKSKLRLLDNGNLRVEGCVLFICGGDEWQPLTVKINLDGSRTVVLKNTPEEN